MRQLAVVASAFFVLIVPSSGQAVEPAKRGATLRLVDRSPLTLRGTAFARYERVRLTIRFDRRSRLVIRRARADGTLAVTLLGVNLRDPCTLVVRGTGAAGSKVAYELSERICPTG